MERQNDLFFLVGQQKTAVADIKEAVCKIEETIKETEVKLKDGLSEHIDNDCLLRKEVMRKIYIGWGLGLGALLLGITLSASTPKAINLLSILFELVGKLLFIYWY